MSQQNTGGGVDPNKNQHGQVAQQLKRPVSAALSGK